jgi:maleylpyruvate isomerase
MWLKGTHWGSSSTVDDVPQPLDAKQLDACVAGCAHSHQRLLEVVDTLTPEQFAGASSLPGWTRLTVVGHLALNAQSHVHLLECATRGEVGEQYPGGPIARQQAIDHASQWEPADAVRHLRHAIYALEGQWAHTTFDAWNNTGVTASGAIVAMHELPFLRWRETVVHLTDLDVGVSFDEWPSLYVRLELDRQKMAWAASHAMGLTLLPQASLQLNPAHRLAWLLQRAHVDGLPIGPGL